MTELSVIIPCLNAEHTLATQLDALVAQQWCKPWEVVLADNGSTDRSVEIARRYATRLNIRVVDASARKKQCFYARNVAVRAAAAERLAFADADDEVCPGWVAAMGEALAQHDFVAGRPCFDRFNTREEVEKFSHLWKDGLYTRQFLPHAGAGNIGIRRSVHDAIGGFDESLPRFGDGDYSWRLQLAGYKIHYEPTAMYQYRIARVKPSLASLFRRAWTAPAADYWTYKKFRSIGVTQDMIVPPNRTLKKSLTRWARCLQALPRSLAATLLGVNRRSLARWTESFLVQNGEVFGQILGRVRNPCTPFPPDKIRIWLPWSTNDPESTGCRAFAVANAEMLDEYAVSVALQSGVSADQAGQLARLRTCSSWSRELEARIVRANRAGHLITRANDEEDQLRKLGF